MTDDPSPGKRARRKPQPRRPTRKVTGVLLLDKPAGISSNAALQRVKYCYEAAKAGHTGSLDPLATGVLPICLGSATRLAGFLLDADKHYRATVRLGARTDTGDAEGQAVEHSDPEQLPAGALEAAIPRFLGAQKQVPPMYSALKRNGRPLYELARRGIEVERPPREITVYALRLLQQTGDEFSFEVRCSKGTYVRTLAEDWAAAVGQCAHLVALRRTGLGPFDESDLVCFRRIEEAPSQAERDALLQPLACLLDGWPRVTADADQITRLGHGQPVRVAGAPDRGRVVVFSATGEVACLAQMDERNRVAPRRWLAS